MTVEDAMKANWWIGVLWTMSALFHGVGSKQWRLVSQVVLLLMEISNQGEKFHASMHTKVNQDVGEEEARGKEKSEKSWNICSTTPLLSQEARANLTTDLGHVLLLGTVFDPSSYPFLQMGKKIIPDKWVYCLHHFSDTDERQ